MRSRVLRALRDDRRLVVAAILGLGVLASLVTVVAVLVTRAAAPPPPEPAEPAGPAQADLPQPLPEVELDDYIVPDEGSRIETWGWERYRTPGEPWTEEHAARFWQEPTGAAREYLRQRNDEEIERIFQNVP
jgi:hypothetical protein